MTINEKSRREDQLLLENFSYAMEGPLATGYPKSTHQQNETCAVFKGNACTDDIEEEERKLAHVYSANSDKSFFGKNFRKKRKV